MKQKVKVALVASWDGWCSPCEREDRPLVLTRSGPGGLLAWITGHGDEDRCLLLTCRVCGQWQVVPRHEEDDPEVVEAVAAPVPVPVPAPRTEQPILLRGLLTSVPPAPTSIALPSETVLDLLASGHQVVFAQAS
jgi:hypothetical protein